MINHHIFTRLLLNIIILILSAIFTFSDDVHSQSNKSGRLTSNFNPNVEELEMLLEAYFAQIEGTVNCMLSLLHLFPENTANSLY